MCNKYYIERSSLELGVLALLLIANVGCGGAVFTDARGIGQPVLIGPVYHIGNAKAGWTQESVGAFDARVTDEAVGAGTTSSYETADQVVTQSTSYGTSVTSGRMSFSSHVRVGLSGRRHRFIHIDEIQCDGGTMLALTAFAHWNECRIDGLIMRPQGKFDW